jgi:DNA-binding IclR family transcriptional regulator
VSRLIINADLTVLSSKVVKTLQNRSCGTEDIAYRCATNRDSIRDQLSKLRRKGLVEHDGRRPRTWKLKEPEAA